MSVLQTVNRVLTPGTKRSVVNPLEQLNEYQLSVLEKEGYDLEFLEAIQPRGGVQFLENGYMTAAGHVRTLKVYGYAKDADLFWLAYLMNNQDTVATLDIATAEKDEVINKINTKLNELEDRSVSERKATDRNDSVHDYRELAEYAANLTKNGEIAKKILLQIHVYAPTLEKLDERCDELMKDIKGTGYKVYPRMFQSKYDYQSLFTNFSQQSHNPNFQRGHTLPSLVLGKGIPLHHQALKDPQGAEYGYTKTGGTFIWDVVQLNSTRLSSNLVMFGTMGAGKSTILKMIAENMLAAGNYVWGFEKAKDFLPLIRSRDGRIVRLDGSEGMINPLEVFATKTDDSGLQVNEKGSFISHLDKVTHQLSLINPELKGTLRSDFRIYLRHFYIRKGLIPKSFKEEAVSSEPFKITGLSPEAYPTLSELWAFIKSIKLEKGTTPAKLARKEQLETMIQELCETYGDMFDGHSTITNLSNEPFVFFDIESIDGLDRGVFQAQLYMAMTLIWNQALIEGRRQKYLYENGQLKEEDMRQFCALIDECHNVVNAHNIETVEYMTNFQREMRKVKSLTVLATQSPQEMVPENANHEHLDQLKKVFELSTQKIFLKMDDSQLQHIKNLVGMSLTQSELQSITSQKKGEAIITFGDRETYRVHITPNQRQLKLFSGGK